MNKFSTSITGDRMEQLRDLVEEKVGRRMNTPRDFDFLAERIFVQLHQNISPTTLKRLWGYLQENVKPRLSSLNLLAQFVGYVDWEDFCLRMDELARPSSSSVAAEMESSVGAELLSADPKMKGSGENRSRSFSPMFLWVVGVLLCGSVAVWLWGYGGKKVDAGGVIADSMQQRKSRPIMLRIGHTFSSFEDYLSLFGISAMDTLWYQPVPHLENLFVWGPEYHHPNWHNEGDKERMMPTITEWWEPTGGADDPKVQEMLHHMNREGYDISHRFDDVRITFMKNLTNDGFVFLGVYRMSMEKSDTMHVVWERVAEECDLNCLEDLLQYRNREK